MTSLDEPLWRSFRASARVAKGEAVCTFGEQESQRLPTRYTIQRGESDHILLTPRALQFTNHSCDPNVAFDFERGRVVAVTAIELGDEITYFYPSTEWEIAEPFACRCGSTACLEMIRGARFTPPEVLARYRCSSFINARARSLRL